MGSRLELQCRLVYERPAVHAHVELNSPRRRLSPPLLPLLSSLAAVLTLKRHAQNQPFTIDYVVGSVSGEIYWEEMEIGGRLVPYQSIGPSNPFYPYLFPFGS